MSIAGLITVVLYGVLLWLGRNEIPAQKKEKLLLPIYKMALFLYHASLKRGLPFGKNARIEQELRTLHPGEGSEELAENFYTGKLAHSMAIHLLGVVFGSLGRQQALWFLMEGTAIATFFLADKDLHDEVEKRRSAMRDAYPDIVYKVLLYLHGGMSVRGALMKISSDCEKRKVYAAGSEKGAPSGGWKMLSGALNFFGGNGDKKDEKDAIYDEIAFTCRELQAGITEGAAYERLGRRTGVREYIRLTALLARNLKKGSTDLESRLLEEARNACEERLRNARRLGEEAGSKLLLPMGMLLLTVMLIIMIPAFSSMGM